MSIKPESLRGLYTDPSKFDPNILTPKNESINPILKSGKTVALVIGNGLASIVALVKFIVIGAFTAIVNLTHRLLKSCNINVLEDRANSLKTDLIIAGVEIADPLLEIHSLISDNSSDTSSITSDDDITERAILQRKSGKKRASIESGPNTSSSHSSSMSDEEINSFYGDTLSFLKQIEAERNDSNNTSTSNTRTSTPNLPCDSTPSSIATSNPMTTEDLEKGSFTKKLIASATTIHSIAGGALSSVRDLISTSFSIGPVPFSFQ